MLLIMVKAVLFLTKIDKSAVFAEPCSMKGLGLVYEKAET